MRKLFDEQGPLAGQRDGEERDQACDQDQHDQKDQQRRQQSVGPGQMALDPADQGVKGDRGQQCDHQPDQDAPHLVDEEEGQTGQQDHADGDSDRPYGDFVVGAVEVKVKAWLVTPGRLDRDRWSGTGCGLPDVAQGSCPRGWPRESAANPTVLSLPRLGGNVTHTG